MKEKKYPSAVSYYAVAVSSLMWVFVKLPLADTIDYVGFALVNLLIFFISYQIWPKRVAVLDRKKKPEKVEEVKTGDADIDRMIMDKTLAIEEMKRLDMNIENELISRQIVHLQEVTDKIVRCVVEKPEKKKQVKRFFNYYLPTTIKLLDTYDRMDNAGISGINIDGTKGKIETMMDTAVKAYDRQLDALYSDEALDISTDITVMENLMKSEGLKVKEK